MWPSKGVVSSGKPGRDASTLHPVWRARRQTQCYWAPANRRQTNLLMRWENSCLEPNGHAIFTWERFRAGGVGEPAVASSRRSARRNDNPRSSLLRSPSCVGAEAIRRECIWLRLLLVRRCYSGGTCPFLAPATRYFTRNCAKIAAPQEMIVIKYTIFTTFVLEYPCFSRR